MKGIYYFPIAQMEKLRSREGIIRALKEGKGGQVAHKSP